MNRVVHIEDLGKRYVLGEGVYGYSTIRESLARVVRRQTHGTGAERFIWALADVNLAVDHGEVIGIIGPNGAGKSTLLRIIARITQPTTGVSRTRGRVGALLDVGTGFHPELTGRENIFLNGSVLGMSRSEIGRRFDAIVEFAEVGRFLETPLKRYSSGMYLRLAFAVAAHLEPEIVVVDEVLAVGDAAFQRKCLGKMSDFRHEGRTVLFVSHDLGAINNLCTRTILLREGRVQADGPTANVVDGYLRSITRRKYEADFPLGSKNRVELRSVAIVDDSGDVKDTIRRGDPVSIQLRFDVRERIPALDVSFSVVSREGARILDESWSDTGRPAQEAGAPGEYEIQLTVPPVLAPGSYVVGIWIGVALAGADETFVHEDVLRFDVDLLPSDPYEWLERNRVLNPGGVAWRVSHQPFEAKSSDD